jgi:hypothetical protein
MNDSAAPTLIERIRREEEVIWDLTKRFASSRGFERALFQRIGERRYFIKNKTIWSALLAERDLVIIDFASWARGICEKGGFFSQLQAHHVQCLRSARSKIFKKSRSSRAEAPAQRDEIDRREADKNSSGATCRQKAWGNLFGNVTHYQVKPELIKKLGAPGFRVVPRRAAQQQPPDRFWR